jgi:acetylornithine deacetylase/succinyl-diaminopimelate desuccinylase-like protein
MFRPGTLLLLFWITCLAVPAVAQVKGNAAWNALARDIFRELIEIDTTDEHGNVSTASEAMARRLLDAGYPAEDVQVLGPNDRKKNLVVRLRGTGKHKPVLQIGHLDVVEAKREDWSTDPFQFVEKDGYFYGRGTQDMKNGDAIMVTTMIRLKKEGFRPSRDLILALTADEEGGTANGVDWLFRTHRALVDAEFVLNHDGASIVSENGKPQFYSMTSSEKVYADFLLTATNPGGHSSIPRRDNAIYQLTAALNRLGEYVFPVELNNMTRAYFEARSKMEQGQRAADMKAILQTPPDAAAAARLLEDPLEGSVMHTTCVATMLSGGHAANALPQRAQANVNCRILPGHPPEEVRQQIERVIADPQIKVQWVDEQLQPQDRGSDAKGFAPPPLRPELMQALNTLVPQFWPGVPIVPGMSAGASDDVFVNNAGLASYAVTGVAIDRTEERAHGQDERLAVESFYAGNEFYYRFIKLLTRK